MSKEILTKFQCDYCEAELITADVPSGWVRILSTTDSVTVGRIAHNNLPPTVWTPRHSISMPQDAYFCSPQHLSKFILDLAKNVVEQAKDIVEQATY